MGKRSPMLKTSPGNFFEDFSLGQKIVHATPRTVTEGDQALYAALYGSRFVVQSSDEFARAIGYAQSPLDDLLVFHIVFGKTVPDISLNAIANLGYAECVFFNPVYPSDTLSAQSEVIGLKENSNGKTGTVYVRSKGINQYGTEVLSFVRWVMVRKRDDRSPPPAACVPEVLQVADVKTELPRLNIAKWNFELSGSPHQFNDYTIGEKIDHLDGMTVEEAEHQLATRLYQNTARVHFNQFAEASGRFGRRLVYGGHVMSLARALSFNGLANAYHIAAINRGRHVAPLFAGGTVFAWSEIIDRIAHDDVGALRIVTRATRDLPCTEYPVDDGTPEKPGVILELDYWALIPRQGTLILD
jgi:2-methylfumaryl-CoA hydratase